MTTKIFFILIALCLIGYIYRNVHKNIMSQDESILWMVGAFAILLLSIWPGFIIHLANLVGVDYAPSLLFLLTSVFTFVLLFRNSQNISELKEKNKELIQNMALMEKRIRDLEEKI